MKQCPACHTNYADDTLRFCLEDGTELETDWSTAKTVSSAEPDRQYVSDDTLVLPPPTTDFQQPEPLGPSPRPGLSKVLIGIIAVLLMAVAALSAVIFVPNFLRLDSDTASLKTSPSPTPASSPTLDIGTDELRSELAELKKLLEQQKNTKSGSVPIASSHLGTIAWANSPEDGFLTLRNQPNADNGTRIAKIPHGSQLTVGKCGEYVTTELGNRGRWCTAVYGGQAGWVFDAFVRYEQK